MGSFSQNTTSQTIGNSWRIFMASNASSMHPAYNSLHMHSYLLGTSHTILIYVFIDETHRKGGRPYAWMRNLRIWTHFVNYFPLSIIKEAELDPNQRYVLGYHPHGIMGVGCIGAFATEGAKFSQIFNNLRLRVLTLDQNFRIPLYRDFLLSLGLASVSATSCNNILSLKQPTSLVIVPGGASEALLAKPKTLNLIVKKRKGFIKLAIRHGASLVPILSFGENDVYNQVPNPEGGRLWKFQKKYQEIIGFAPPLFYGRGIFNYDFGLLPQRVKITIVVGRPIPCEQNPHPTTEEVTDVQEKYIAEIQRLWDKYKDQCASDRMSDLIIVE